MEQVNSFKEVSQQIFAALKKSEKVLIPLHIRPDGDVIASTLAFSYVLKKMKKKTSVVSADAVPSEFSFLPKFEEIIYKDPAEIEPNQFDLLLLLDLATPARSTPLARVSKQVFLISQSIPIICIDHHPKSKGFGTINFVDYKKSSTSEILYYIFTEWEIKIDKLLATLLLFGIFSDTGCFQYENSQPSTLFSAGKLLELGAPLGEFVFRMYRSNKFGTLKFWGKCLENLKIDKKRRFAWTTISFEELKKLKIDLKEAFGFHNVFLHNIDNTDFAFSLIEFEPGVVKGSFRVRADFDVSKVAKVLGGGGLKSAAGYVLEMSLPEAEKKVLEVVRKFILSGKGVK